MPLILQVASEADAQRAAVIEKAAYHANPFDKVLFPGPFPEPEPGRSTRAEEMSKELREDSSVRWLKVVDTDIEPTEDNQQMIGFAQWIIKDGSQPPTGPRNFGPGCNVEACEALFGGLYKLRVKYTTGKKNAHLRGLQVVPEHQHRGAGRMMVMWGIEEAKRLGYPAYLESSPEGYALYASCGFHEIDKLVVDCTKWGKPAELIVRLMVTELP